MNAVYIFIGEWKYDGMTILAVRFDKHQAFNDFQSILEADQFQHDSYRLEEWTEQGHTVIDERC